MQPTNCVVNKVTNDGIFFVRFVIMVIVKLIMLKTVLILLKKYVQKAVLELLVQVRMS